MFRINWLWSVPNLFRICSVFLKLQAVKQSGPVYFGLPCRILSKTFSVIMHTKYADKWREELGERETERDQNNPYNEVVGWQIYFYYMKHKSFPSKRRNSTLLSISVKFPITTWPKFPQCQQSALVNSVGRHQKFYATTRPTIAILFCGGFRRPAVRRFLADRKPVALIYATVRLSSSVVCLSSDCNVCIVAKRQTYYWQPIGNRKSYRAYKESIVAEMNDLDLCLEVVIRIKFMATIVFLNRVVIDGLGSVSVWSGGVDIKEIG